MPKDKTKIRVRIRKSHTGDPYSEVSYDVPRSIMFSADETSLFHKPAVRTGLLIAAAIIALIAAALIAIPFGPQENDVTVQANGADMPLHPAVEQGEEEALSSAEDDILPDSAAPPDSDTASPSPSEAESGADVGADLQSPAAPETAMPPADDSSSLEALETKEAGSALPETEADEPEPLTSPQGGEQASQSSEPLTETQPDDVFAPQPSVTPEPPSTQVQAPGAAPAEEGTELSLDSAPDATETTDTPMLVEPQQPSAVARAQFTHNVVQREPVDSIDSVFYATGDDTDQIYYFTELVGLKGETITHRWEYQGEVIATVEFNVGGNRWRVYSRKTLLPSMTGQWRVVVVDTEGNTLQTDEFTYAARDS